MADYTYTEDGKLHCRYSEILRCTPAGIDRVLYDRQNLDDRFESDSMLDGTLRHEAFEEESRRTGKLPACFGLDWPVSHVEHEFTTELLPGVVVHSRPDTVCASIETICDNKTVLDGLRGWKHNLEKYGWRPVYDSKHRLIGHKVVAAGAQRQLIFYAYQLGLHGIRIRKGAFLCEIWNKDRTEIIGYEVVEFPITLKDMAAVLAWAKPRIALLASVLEEIPA